MYLGIPQLIVICLAVGGLVRSAIQHGEPDGKVDFWVTLTATAIQFGLLYWGGFFNG